MNTPQVDLVGLRDIARRAGVDISQVVAWVATDDFPVVRSHLDGGPQWVWGPVHLWLREHHHRGDADLTI